MVAGIDEGKMSSKRLIKVRSFPGATCSDMYHCLVPILERKPDHVILLVGTNDVTHYEVTEIVDKLLKLKSFFAEQLPITHIVISHPITRINSKHLAMKIGDIQSHLRKLQIDMIENGNINSNHLNNRGLHLNGKGILQFAKTLIEGIRKLWCEKELLRQKKVSLESCDHNSRISPNNFSHNNTFIQPSVNSINFFNANIKKQRESVANQISNTAKNTNHNLGIEELINLRTLYTNNPIIGYLNINSLENKITELREVCRKAPIDLLCIDETKLDASFPDAQFHIEGCQHPHLGKIVTKMVGWNDFYKEGLIAKRSYAIEDITSETICLEVTISNKKWCITFVYRPSSNSNKDTFFKEFIKFLSNITRKYENVLVAVDLIIDTLHEKRFEKLLI